MKRVGNIVPGAVVCPGKCLRVGWRVDDGLIACGLEALKNPLISGMVDLTVSTTINKPEVYLSVLLPAGQMSGCLFHLKQI